MFAMHISLVTLQQFLLFPGPYSGGELTLQTVSLLPAVSSSAIDLCFAHTSTNAEMVTVPVLRFLWREIPVGGLVSLLT